MKKFLVFTFKAIAVLLLFACASRQVKNIASPGDEQHPQNTASGSSSRETDINRLAGTWTFDNPDYAGIHIVFGEDNTITMGEESVIAIGTYHVNFQVEPIQLDIQWPEQGSVKTIIRFIDDNKIQIENSDLETERPEFFSDNSELLIRVK